MLPIKSNPWPESHHRLAVRATVMYVRRGGNFTGFSIICILNFFQGTTFMILIGFIVICEKNYLDIPQKSILCHTDKTFSEYAKTYCWIHGTSYVREALRGKES